MIFNLCLRSAKMLSFLHKKVLKYLCRPVLICKCSDTGLTKTLENSACILVALFLQAQEISFVVLRKTLIN